ncbi:hypothetical protein A1359_12115 [Methylomonas lenta]|uniref:Uncharacterized protein n=1 Tax=Methylomonas lenta TaxID=980561 RepID=A0A177N6R5_9GAMM|nr:hypothetical protein [Methylomonas lenta]OAI13677.1 hypothetical protein A1359_12115 [Methylomonas lenta]
MQHGFPKNAWDSAKDEALHVLRNRAARRHNQTISYTELVESLTAIQIGAHDPRLSSFLEEIVIAEHTNGRPLITVLVVHATGDLMPGDGFYDISEQLGFNVADSEAFWIAEFQRTLNYWQQPDNI